jgi:flavin reductase (DIM6/NTAB) family NADH-FMN oxidoreductase RutF
VKIKLGKVPYIYPVPIVLAGANVDHKPSFTTLGDVGLLGINPPLVLISSHQEHYLNVGILETGCYSINFPTTDMLSLVDYCGQVSGREVDKGALFDVFYGDLRTAPLIRECPINLECKVVKEFSIEHRQIFIGEVVQTHLDEDFAREVDGKVRVAELGQLDPILYALDNRYYAVGGVIGTGYQEASKLAEKE